MSDSHFVVQTSKFLLIDATAVALGEGHGKFIQYILPDQYILCSKYLRAQMVLTLEAKVVAAADAAVTDGAETNWKHKSHPRPGWLNYGAP